LEEDESQKTHDATPRKLQQAREKGDVAKSQDVASAVILAVAAGLFLIMGTWFSRHMVADFIVFFERPHELAMDGGALWQLLLAVTIKAGIVLGVVMAGLSVAALAGNLGQTGFLYTTEKLIPKLDKISPMKGFKRLFGADALMQFAKTTFKVGFLCVVTGWILWPRWDQAKALVHMEPAAMGPILFEVLAQLFMALIIVIVVASGIDYILQRQSFLKRNKMSMQEIKDEYRQTEGDPLVKGKLRQIRVERGRKRMMQSVPDATVIITNPTHYAVALRYDPAVDAAPVCVAKGLDQVALKIREIAGAHEVPIVENPPLARALHATVEIDDTIPAEHFEAVAKIIGVIFSVAAKRKSRQQSPNATSRPAGVAA
jgi:flagellar biosynthesis protein FlhB